MKPTPFWCGTTKIYIKESCNFKKETIRRRETHGILGPIFFLVLARNRVLFTSDRVVEKEFVIKERENRDRESNIL